MTPSPPAPRRGRPPEGAREALLIAGTALFADHGFDGTTVEEIAARARANKAMINYYFGGKEGLYAAILDDTLGSAHERLKEAFESPLPADKRLRRFLEIFVAAASRRPGFPAMVLREAISGGRHLRPETIPRFLGIFAMVRSIVEQGMRDGTFRKVNPFCTHLSLIGSLVFFYATQKFRVRVIEAARLPIEDIPPEEFLEHTCELMTRGLRADRVLRRRGRSAAGRSGRRPDGRRT